MKVFLTSVLVAMLVAGGPSVASAQEGSGFDAKAVASACNGGDCAASVEKAISDLKASGRTQEEIDSALATLATELILVAVVAPELKAVIASALSTVSGTVENRALANNIASAANEVAQGNASSDLGDAVGGVPDPNGSPA